MKDSITDIRQRRKVGHYLPVRAICAGLWLLSILTLIVAAIVAAGRLP